MNPEQVKQAAAYIREFLTAEPTIGLILGSGLGDLADRMEAKVKIPYQDIPGFPLSTVQGHQGCLVYGTLSGAKVIAMQGRFHYYEGHSLQAITSPVRVFHLLGVHTLMVTNAAGGVNTEFRPGDLMLITDHLNLTGNNPLIGPHTAEWGPRFPDMSQAYSLQLQAIARKAAEERAIPLRSGVYAGLSGPSYETPAEIRMLRTLGADAVGMSTVPEIIVAGHMGMRALGISCITNMAAGILDQPLSHDEVLETTKKAKADFIALMEGIIKQYADPEMGNAE
jgi:purine-nucleoside phosphorylase